MKLIVAILLFWTSFIAFSQKEYHSLREDEKMEIDGFMNEKIWSSLEEATDFIVKSPTFGGKSRFISKVKVCYGADALFVAGEMYDLAPDSVNYALSQRDDFGNADWFAVSIDTYGGYVNAFMFAVTAAGVELDALESVNGEDYSWNAVWKSEVQKRDFGWSFEMRIPFSAIRFPNKDIQEWNINFTRNVRRIRETSKWNPVDPNKFGEITQAGKIKGIQGIKSPVRLSFTPYGTLYLENSESVTGQNEWGIRATGGLDLKYGLNDAFTLDMTLIPDFGQTTSDNQVLNLGPFEIQYNENRPFFIEGTDLFEIGGVFYSRRIGAQPYGYYDAYDGLDANKGEEVIENPPVNAMINGTKVSGRTKKGLGIGVFNTLENRSYAVVRDSLGNTRRVETNPLTNYNMLVFSQNLANNSAVSLVNTNVTREGSARDANVTVADADIYTKDGKYNLNTSVKVSQVFENDKMTNGHAFFSELEKVSGLWRYSVWYNEESDTYDPNDLGFIYANNERTIGGKLLYRNYEPSKYFFNRDAGVFVTYQQLYKPQIYSSLDVEAYVGGTTKNQTYTRLKAGGSPVGSLRHFESRSFGRPVYYMPNAYVGWFFTSDYSKVFALDGDISWKQFFGREQYEWSVWISPRVRLNDRMNLVLDIGFDYLYGDYGYVSGANQNNGNDIYLGERQMYIYENELTAEFIFTKRMGLDLRLRHYLHQVEYNEFYRLRKDAGIESVAYNPQDSKGNSVFNTAYNAFTLDVNYRWVFLPGSELRVVYKNNIFQTKSELDANYFAVFDDMFDQPQINSISMKLLVFIDVLYFKKLDKKNRTNI